MRQPHSVSLFSPISPLRSLSSHRRRRRRRRRRQPTVAASTAMASQPTATVEMETVRMKYDLDLGMELDSLFLDDFTQSLDASLTGFQEIKDAIAVCEWVFPESIN